MISGETISGGSVTSTKPAAGLLFYQAGVAILSASVFQSNHATATIRATNGPAQGNDTIQIFAADGSQMQLSQR